MKVMCLKELAKPTTEFTIAATNHEDFQILRSFKELAENPRYILLMSDFGISFKDDEVSHIKFGLKDKKSLTFKQKLHRVKSTLLDLIRA